MSKDKEEVLSKSFLNAVIDGIKTFDGVFGMGAFIEERPRISTGSLSLDLLLGGGIGSDRIIEYYGPPSSFKTSFALLGIKSYVDKFGYSKPPYIIDVERTITANFVRSFGINPDKIFVARPKSAEETMQIVSNIMSTGQFGIGLLDSVDALESEEDRKKNYGESSMMKLPKLLSEAMRDLSKSCVDNNTGLILINQCRTGMSAYQAVETTSGGKAIPYYASQRIRFANKGPSKEVKGAVEVKANIKKNKLSSLIVAELDLHFIPAKGVETISDYLTVGEKFGVVVRGGAYYSIYEGTNFIEKVHTKNGFLEWITRTPDNKIMFENLVEERFKELSGTLIEDSKGKENEEDIID